MAFFKFRKSTGDAPASEVPVQSVETIRQRAKYRLLGATVLILVGVIGLPLLFDNQPRPLAVDTPIDIPDKNKVLPLVIAAAPPSAAPDGKTVAPAPAAVAPAKNPSAAASASPQEPVAPKREAPAAVVSPQVAKPAAAPAATAVAVNRAEALLAGKDLAVADSPKPADVAGQRFVVQVGAFADDARAREVRLKVEKTGLKTYTQIANTKDGKRIRVRVGPFASKAEAEKVATRIKKLDLSAVLLTL